MCSRVLRIDPRISGPKFLDSSWSICIIFFLLLAPRGTWGLHSLPPTNSVQSDHFSLASCGTHCLNLFLDCSSLGGFWYALLSFLLGSPSKSYPCDSIGRYPLNMHEPPNSNSNSDKLRYSKEYQILFYCCLNPSRLPLQLAEHIPDSIPSIFYING